MTTTKKTTILPSIIEVNSSLEKSNNYQSAKLEYEFFNNFRSEHTKISYRNDILQFLDFMIENFKHETLNYEDIEKIHLVAYRNWMSENDYAPKTINRKLSSLSSYFDFLVEKNLMKYNPTTSIKRPRQEVKKPTNDLSDEQIIALFNALKTDGPSAYLHRAVIYVLFSTGIRKSELINLKLKDYNVKDGLHYLEVTGKGGKFLVKALHQECVKVLQEYLSWMRIHGRSMHNEDWIFRPTKNPKNPGEIDGQLGPKSIDYIVKTWTRKAGIFDRISPHSARASYIGSALENGQDIFKVSQDVGHASVKTTQEYNKRRLQIKDSPAYGLGFFDPKKAG